LTFPNNAGPLFAALGDETRLAIVLRLGAGTPLSISRLAAGFAITRQAVTKHLRVLEQAGLVRTMKSGRESVWELERDRVIEARQYLDEISKQWDEKIERLRELVEE